MTELSCSFDEFKRMAKEFHFAAPTLNLEELDNAWKCLSLGFINMNEDMWRNSALTLFNMEARTYFARESELLEDYGN